MRIYVNGRNIEITDAIKAYAKEKIGKVATHYDQITGIDVVLSVIKNPSVAENHTAEVSCKFTDKLARQVQKYKEKNLKSKTHSDSIRKEGVSADVEEAEVVVEAE